MKFLLQKNNKFQKRLTLFIFFGCFFFIGSNIFNQYGIPIDQAELRDLGFITLNYVYEVFPQLKLDLMKDIPTSTNLQEWHGKDHGAFIETLFAFIESVFHIEETKNKFLFRHYLCFLIFFISTYFFYLIVNFRYKDWRISLLGCVFLILSPRIFAESFYNTKDLVFMSLFTISLYCCLKFIYKPTFKRAIAFAITSGLATDLRVMGIMLPFLTILFLLYLSLRNKKFINKNANPILLFLFLTPFFIILFWPYLWTDPINNFFQAFKNFSSYWFDIKSLYLGNYINASKVPWHYPIVWISITTPILYIILFISGFYISSIRFIKRLLNMDETKELNDLWRGSKEMIDLMIILCFFSPIFLVILLNSTLHDGWRHLYFVYPSFLLLSIYGYDQISKKIKRVKKNFFHLSFVLLVLMLLVINLINMIKIHPYQNVYFNYLAGKKPEKNFTVDYWGLSNKQALELILLDENKESYKIYPASNTDLYLSSLIFSEKDKEKIKIVFDKNIADYIISNGIFWGGNPKDDFAKIPSNFILFDTIRSGRTEVVSIFKKKNN